MTSSERTESPAPGASTSLENAQADVIMVGGGLAGCLLALRLAETGQRILIVEAGPQICGNHTWSFHGTDLAADDLQRLDSVIAHRWPAQRVIFPRYRRDLATPYASITSETMREAVRALPTVSIRENCRIAEMAADHVLLEDGSRIDAPCIIDGRGFAPARGLRLGFQKFVGVEVECDTPHGETVPTIMDASVDQLDGYRFVYVLPLSPSRLLIEDTRYSDGGELDPEALKSELRAYATQRGWGAHEIVRDEQGVLPITLAHDPSLFWDSMPAHLAPIGLRAGLFHPTTGYSLPSAMETANLIAAIEGRLTTRAVRDAVQRHAVERSRQQSVFRFLNRMLFQAAEPHKRYVVLQRFYSLPQPLIERFYAGRLGPLDRMRVLIGKPPVPIHRALRCVRETQALTNH